MQTILNRLNRVRIPDMPPNIMTRRQLSGCYYCVRVFQASKITKYTKDGAALCPFCGIDAVLDGVMCRVALKRYHDKKFGTMEKL